MEGANQLLSRWIKKGFEHEHDFGNRIGPTASLLVRYGSQQDSERWTPKVMDLFLHCVHKGDQLGSPALELFFHPPKNSS